MPHKNNDLELTVIDFFCGWGGFSEGFRQQGFKVLMGIDHWQPAIDTHNLNHWLSDGTKSVLDFWSEDSGDVAQIESLPDSTCIIWSPPCVSFSSSNKSWKADKTLWIRLIEAYLRVVAVKKHKPNSKLRAWFMENVPNSRKYVWPEYTFRMLALSSWAEKMGKRPDDVALRVRDNWLILNSGDYGAPQSRKRFVAGELSTSWEFPVPVQTHFDHVTLGKILSRLPAPNTSKESVLSSRYVDPNYPEIEIHWGSLTDHFYDSGIYTVEWESARYFKQNHSYMGRMSFPESMDRPCRTIMATKSAKTREALILESEYARKWNGQYRVPTIREISCLMGFPISYQFCWSEWTKWRQIGNAVSPHLSSALAKAVLDSLRLPEVSSIPHLHLEQFNSENLNTYQEKKFDSPKTRKSGARFRRHTVKSGNMIVELMNYAESTDWSVWDWQMRMFFWTGNGYREYQIDKRIYAEVHRYLESESVTFSEFSELVERRTKWIDSRNFQFIYENDLNITNPSNPILILDWMSGIIQENNEANRIAVNCASLPKKNIPFWQLFAIYSIWGLIF